MNDVPTFGVLLRELRAVAGVSQNALARSAQIDPAYVNRLERKNGHAQQHPARAIVLQLADALDASPLDRDRLLVAAGHVPEAVVVAGGWDRYLDALAANVAAVVRGRA